MKTKHEITLTAEQAGEVLAPIISVVMSMNSDRTQYWIGHKKKLEREVRKILAGLDRNQYIDLIQDWQNFYADVFGIKADFSNLVLPEKREGFDRLIIVVQGMTPQCLYDKCAELFKIWKWTDKNLEEIVVSDRTEKNGPYTILVRDRVEADEELSNLSANQIKKQDIPGITLEERLIYELKYFKETGKHLDIQNWTLCAGSRFSDGRVPSVNWNPNYGKVNVNWYNLGNANDNLRSREKFQKRNPDNRDFFNCI